MKTKLIICFIAVCNLVNAQWQQISFFNNGGIYSFAFRDSNVFVGANYGLFISNNNGITWTQSLGLPYSNVTALAVKDTNIFAGTWDNGMFLSINNGQSWSAIDSGFAKDTGVSILAISGNSVFAGTGGKGVYMTNNNGVTWSAINNGLPVRSNIEGLAVNGTTLFAGGPFSNDYGLYSSTNNGVNWTSIVPQYSFYPDAITVIDTNIFAGTYGFGMHYSHNGGASWNNVNTGLPADTHGFIYITTMINIGTTLIAGTDSGIYISSNYGTNWFSFNNGLVPPYLSVSALAVNGPTLYAGVGSNIYKIQLSQILSVHEIANSPEVSLYPNPSNGRFTIKTNGINRKEYIQVFDILGRNVYAAPLNSNDTEIDLGNNAKGIYLYQIVTEKEELLSSGKIAIQ